VKGDAPSETELARAYRRLGDVQGYVQGSNLGDPEGALARYRTALALLDDALRIAPRSLDAATERLIVYRRVGTLQAYTSRLPDAVKTLREGIELGAPLSASGDPDLMAALAELYLGSSEARRNMGDDRGAVDDASECLRLYQEIVGRRPSDPDLRQALSNAHAAVGMAESGLGLLREALAHYRSGADEMERLVATAPSNVSWSRDLMLAYGHVADVLGNPDMQNLGDRQGALLEYRKAAEIGRRLYEADRADQRAASDYGIILSRVETAMEDGDVAAKVAVQRESLRVLEEASGISPGDVSLRIYRSLVTQHLGDSFTAGGQLEPAFQAYRESATMAASGIDTGHASLLTLYIQSNRRLALNAVGRGHRDEALRFAREALRASETSPPGTAALRAAPRGLAAMGLTYEALARNPPRATKDRDEALSWLTRSLEAWRAAQAEAGFAAPHRREMREVEEALSRVRQHDDG
jgi:tetratricopeptide (TPR) repeat protein